MDDKAKQVEEWLTAEIKLIEESIAELVRDKETLENRLMAHRLGYIPSDTIKRKNSGPRVTVEARVMATLGKVKQMRSIALYREAVEVFPELNYGTFRGYLCRMKKRGLIIRGIRNGWWRLKPENPAEQAKQDFAEYLDKLAGQKEPAESH